MALPLACDWWVLPVGVGGVTGSRWSRREGSCPPGRGEDTVRQIVAGLTGDSDGTGGLGCWKAVQRRTLQAWGAGQDSEDDSGERRTGSPTPWSQIQVSVEAAL